MHRTTHIRSIAVTLALVLATVGSFASSASATGTSSISGVAFYDLDRDGSKDTSEEPLAGKGIYLFDASGSFIAVAGTSAAGGYTFEGLTDGTYRVEIASRDWLEFRQDWVPTTTGSLKPAATVTLSGRATADFGIRPIVRSTDISTPLSSFVGPQGLVVKSYDDVVPARGIYDALMSGSQIGPEAATSTIYFDYGTQTSAVTSVGGAQGSWSGWNASIWIAYAPWLESYDTVLFHEYGHNWTLYNAYIVQQDDTFSGYLAARGLTGDPRLDTSKSWSPREMIAEDYRQLFGSANARSHALQNSDIPPAAEVPGLEQYLATTFTQPPAGSDPAPAPEPTPSPEPSPSSDPSPSPEPTPTDAPATTRKGKGGGGGGGKKR